MFRDIPIDGLFTSESNYFDPSTVDSTEGASALTDSMNAFWNCLT